MTQKFTRFAIPLLATLLVSSCMAQTPPDREHTIHPFNLKIWSTLEVDLQAVEKTYIYTFSIDLFTGKKNSTEQRKIAELWGGNGGYYKDTDTPIAVGIPIPVRLTIERITSSGHESIFDKEIFKESNWAGSSTQLSKLVASIKLEPGHYRVKLEALDTVTELNDVPVQFRILIEHK